MVTDSVAPVVSTKGVATIVTAEGMSCLSENLTWKTVHVKTFQTKNEIHYGLIIHESAIGKQWRNAKKRLYLTADAMVLTPKGWIPVSDLRLKSDDTPEHIMGYLVRCVICQKLYIPRRPFHSTCSEPCIAKALRSGIIAFRPLNAESVPSCMVQDWIPVVRVLKVELPAGIEGVSVYNIEDGNSLFVNGVLISSLSLQNRVE
jgi:hypothetical protein